MVDLPRAERQRWLVEKCAALVAGGAEPVNGLILPTGKFFPDSFDGGLRSVQKLLARIVKHAGMSDLRFTLRVPKPADDVLSGGGGCSSGACGTSAAGAAANERYRRIEETDDGYTVTILPQDGKNPTTLTVAMVRAVSQAFLKEASLFEEFDPREAELAIDLAGTMLGFGVLLANGSYLYSKG